MSRQIGTLLLYCELFAPGKLHDSIKIQKTIFGRRKQQKPLKAEIGPDPFQGVVLFRGCVVLFWFGCIKISRQHCKADIDIQMLMYVSQLAKSLIMLAQQ
jgi:hypothetical protein